MLEKKPGRPRTAKRPSARITINDLGISGMNKKASAKLLQIVTVAVELFHSKGYGPTTTRDIGRACNISPGHLYYYIKSKDAIPGMFRKIHDNEMRSWEESIRREWKRLSPEELLEKAVRDYAYGIHLRRKMVVFWYHAAIQVKREDQIATMAIESRVDDLFQEIIELGNKEGQFHVKDPFILSFNILMMCQTWALKRWQIRDSRTFDQYLDTIVELIKTMVRGIPEAGAKKARRV